MSKTIGPYRLNPRGDYNPAADPLYSLLDLVSDGGGSFVYINDTPSNEPTSSTSHWQQIATMGGQDLVDAAVTARDAAVSAKDTAVAAAATLVGTVANGLTAKGASAYASLPTTGNEIGDYYYCSDGTPAGNYVWNGTAWYFGGTGDEGYSDLRDLLDGSVFSDNLFDGEDAISGLGYHTGAGTLVPSAEFSYAIINVEENTKLSITGTRNINPYGYAFNNSSGSRIVMAAVTKNEFILDVPAGSKTLVITVTNDDFGSFSVRKLYKMTDPALINADISALDAKMAAYTAKKVKIKDFDDLVDGYRYLAFSSGVCFRGKEVHVTRLAVTHLGTIDKGKLIFHVRDEIGVIEAVYPTIDYDTITTGELRDPNLSKTRDGNYLLLSAFAYDYATEAVTGSYLFVLDENYNTVSQCALNFGLGFAAWGNTLQNADGYLYKTAYNGSGVKIFKSNAVFTSDVSALTFTEIKAYANGATQLCEPNICYVGDKMLIVMRNDGGNAVWSISDNAIDNWSAAENIGYVLHSPAMFPFYSTKVIAFAGSYPISASVRAPVIVWFDAETGLTKRIHVVDDTLTGWGGYPSFINLGNEYAMVYYDDYINSRSSFYYKRINPYYHCDTDYFVNP